VESLKVVIKVVSFRFYFSLITFIILRKHPLFILLYLLMILIFICQTPGLMFFGQLPTLNYAKLTTGLEQTSFLLTTRKQILYY